MVVQLKFFELRKFPTPEAKAAARDRLDERLSREFADFVGSMRGAFVKVAQVLGSLSPPPVRKPYIEKLEPMADAAPGGRAWKSVERQITRELRRGPGNKRRTIRDVFSSFDPEPIGTASVGQVHRAVLRSDGRTVAVKLQVSRRNRAWGLSILAMHHCSLLTCACAWPCFDLCARAVPGLQVSHPNRSDQHPSNSQAAREEGGGGRRGVSPNASPPARAA